MASIIANLLRRNLYDVFGEDDAELRRRAIAEIFADQATFYAPDGTHHGHAAIDRIAGTIRAAHPHFRYTEIAAPEELGGTAGRIRWVEGTPGEQPVYAGTDFIVVSDGRIVGLYLFFDELPR